MINEQLWNAACLRAFADPTKTQTQHYMEMLEAQLERVYANPNGDDNE